MEIHKNGQPDTWGRHNNGRPWWRELKKHKDRLHGDQPDWFRMAEELGWDAAIIHYLNDNPRTSHEFRTLAAWEGRTGREVYSRNDWHVALFEKSYGQRSRPNEEVSIQELVEALQEVWDSGLEATRHQSCSQRYGNPDGRRQYAALKNLASAYHVNQRNYGEKSRRGMITIAAKFLPKLLNFALENKDENLYNKIHSNWKVIKRLQNEHLSSRSYSEGLRRYQTEVDAGVRGGQQTFPIFTRPESSAHA